MRLKTPFRGRLRATISTAAFEVEHSEFVRHIGPTKRHASIKCGGRARNDDGQQEHRVLRKITVEKPERQSSHFSHTCNVR